MVTPGPESVESRIGLRNSSSPCRPRKSDWSPGLVDMRGDVDEEGWEYAFYWNGRYWWCGGNWHGKAVLIHGWVRRRKWIRELQRKQVSPLETEVDEKQEVVTEEGESEKPGGGGFDGLLSV